MIKKGKWYHETFPVRLQQARVAANLTQEELGKKVGVVGTQLSRYERGLQEPTSPTASRLAAALDVPCNWLFLGGRYRSNQWKCAPGTASPDTTVEPSHALEPEQAPEQLAPVPVETDTSEGTDEITLADVFHALLRVEELTGTQFTIGYGDDNTLHLTVDPALAAAFAQRSLMLASGFVSTGLRPTMYDSFLRMAEQMLRQRTIERNENNG